MLLLIFYVSLAVLVSFLCSVAEAVILSVSTSYVASAEQDGKRYARHLKKLKNEINSPLAVILTLNTIAHTIGAAGAGAQAALLFGNVYLGVFSGLLTLVILIFSEIIPKALGAHYWRQLAPVTSYVLIAMVKLLYPFVILSNMLTRRLQGESQLQGFSRKEFAAMASLGEEEGQLEERESVVLQNLLQLREMRVSEVMTPRSVVFSVDQQRSIDDFFEESKSQRFSRVPIFDQPESICGFVLRSDLLVAQAAGDGDTPLLDYRRELQAIGGGASLMSAFEILVSRQLQILLVVDEYGGVQGLVTLEDILEALLGLNIMDESDTVADMQELAKRLGARRRRKMGLD